KSWLTSKSIDTTEWGCGVTKSVENLWSEIIAGETELQDEPPLRLVRIVQVLVYQRDKTLVEVGQEFGEGQQRYRGFPPSEKVKPQESPQEAALRCLQEELQVEPNQAELVSVLEPEQIYQESPSYPGLATCYLTYGVEVKVMGLPEGEFWTNESPHADGDPVTNHHWGWVAKEKL
ncbi:MAG: NUDIX domain-containing protein, partial [Anaerolineae bacterium]